MGCRLWGHTESNTTDDLAAAAAAAAACTSMEKEMATHSNILAWRISWMEEPGGLQTMGSQGVRHD